MKSNDKTEKMLFPSIFDGGLAGGQTGNDQCCPYTIAASAARSSVRSAMVSPVTCMVLADHG